MQDADPLAALGKKVDDPVVKALVGLVHERCRVDTTSQFSCPFAGVDLAVSIAKDESLVVRQVRLYVNARGAYSSYQGTLPFGFTRAARRPEVLETLGPPDQVTSDTDIYQARSPKVIVTYHSGASNPDSGLIRYIVLVNK